jgi:ribonuclease E
MLEIERQNTESAADGRAGSDASLTGPSASPGKPGESADSGSQGKGLLRRRRAVTRPAGPPAAEPPAPAVTTAPAASQVGAAAEEPRAGERPAAAAPGAGTTPDTGTTGTTPGTGTSRAPRKRASRAKVPQASQDDQAKPGKGTAAGDAAPAGGPPDGAQPVTVPPTTVPPTTGPPTTGPLTVAPSAGAPSAAGPPAAVPQAAFQPPLVIFQPPDITVARPPAQRPERQQQGGQSGQQRGGQQRGQGPAGADTEGEAEPIEVEEGAEADARDEIATGSASRRRRRGGRGRGKATGGPADGAEHARSGADDQHEQVDAEDDQDQQGEDGPQEPGATAKRRRRRRRTGASADTEAPPSGSPDDPPNTVVHVRTPREKSADASDVRAIKGSTRLEAKRQRRREGRESGRRRPPIITESEFLARREAVERVMVVRQHDDRTQIAVLEDGVLVEHYVDKASHQSYVGNVYLGKVQNVLPSMEAAFVDIGKGRNAVLYAGEVNFDASGLEGESKRIESALKSGQSILVQVTKDPIGHKGARLTSQVSLPGRYLVYVPGASMTGISRKLPDTERSRLKQILKQVMPENAGVIVRTAAEGASEEELSRDVARLAAQWEAIEKKAKTAAAPELLYSEPDLTLRVVRDIFNEDFTNLVIASDTEWDLVDEYVRYVAPHLADRMERWDAAEDVFAAHRIDEQIAKALERKVWLPSGGSLVIDHTEAMTVIDVNTGKFTGQGGNLEQTVTRNNLEAAEEIVRQLRLRDLGGIIVIDFIDMVLESNRELVLRRLLECLARDRTKHQVAEVTSLGLVQMTRKRVGSGLLEAFSVPCEHCNNRGVIVSLEPVDHAPARGRSEDGHGRDSSGDSGTRNGRSRGGRPVPGGPAAARGKDESGGSGDAGKNGEAGQDGVGGSSGGGSRARSGRTRSGRSGGSGQALADGSGQLDGTAPAGIATATGTAATGAAATGTAAAADRSEGRPESSSDQQASDALGSAGPGSAELDSAAQDSAGQASADGVAGVDSGSGSAQDSSARSARSRSHRSRRSGRQVVAPVVADVAGADSADSDAIGSDAGSPDAASDS